MVMQSIMRRHVKMAAAPAQLTLAIIFGVIPASAPAVSVANALALLGTMESAGFGATAYVTTGQHYNWLTVAVIVAGLVIGAVSLSLG